MTNMNIEKRKNEYYKFIEDYKNNHMFCPICGYENYTSTLFGFVFDLTTKEKYKDLNDCVCLKCGSIHTKHDRTHLKK